MSSAAPKVIFLHIPKTAGQSVHAALVHAFGAEAVCPARVNEQLVGMTINELNRYRVFSGHLDWSLLDCVRGPRFVFTVLREPRDRILSFYFYLREQASKLSADDLEKPQNQGMRAALKLTPDQYFCAGPPHLRRFLDDHYDNFYTYFFAGRYYNARGVINGRLQRQEVTQSGIVDRALENLATLDGVYAVDDMTAAFAQIRALGTMEIKSDDRYRVNVNAAVQAGQRTDRLRTLGATDAAFERIEQYCSMDNALWQRAPIKASIE